MVLHQYRVIQISAKYMSDFNAHLSVFSTAQCKLTVKSSAKNNNF